MAEHGIAPTGIGIAAQLRDLHGIGIALKCTGLAESASASQRLRNGLFGKGMAIQSEADKGTAEAWS